jgi:hypothetical protein
MLQHGLSRSSALWALSFWSQTIMHDTLTRLEPPVSLVRSDRARSLTVAADGGDRGRLQPDGQVVGQLYLSPAAEAWVVRRHTFLGGGDNECS